MVVFGQGCSIRAMRMYSGKNGCIWTSFSIRAKWLYSDKVVLFGKKWLYLGETVVFGQKWLYSSKVVVLGQKLL